MGEGKKMKKILSLFLLTLTGCGTIPTTGHRSLMGLKVPFTANQSRVTIERTWLEIMAEQLAPFQWVGLACVVLGVVMTAFKFFDSKTGVLFVALGFGLSLWAIAAPRFVGLAIAFAGVALAFGMGYIIYSLITGKKIPRLADALSK